MAKAKTKPCPHGIPVTDIMRCPVYEPQLLAVQTPEEMTAWQKALQIQQSQKFVIRNYVTANMEAICSWDTYCDATGPISGGTAFLVLLALSQFAWTDPAEIYPGNQRLANMTGLSKGCARRVKLMWIELGVLNLTREGVSKKHTDKIRMSLEKIERFVAMANIRMGAPDVPNALDGFKPDIAGDKAAEAREFAEQDVESADISSEDKGVEKRP